MVAEPDRFETWDAGARSVLLGAKEEAQRLSHNYIGSEHLLLALVRNESNKACRLLLGLGVELSKVISGAEFIIGRGDYSSPGELGSTPRMKKIIELSVDEARRLNDSKVGAEHLLVGIMREGEGVAAGILESLGVSLNRVRSAHRLLRGPQRPGISDEDIAQALKSLEQARKSLEEARAVFLQIWPELEEQKS
ncbi:MAG: hypothetical protein A3A27_02045 [Candidatus Wildermuthbacteria bacterium RIFCSPLOWO2_01_FULL_47_18]|uniref:Clp R domain-containing protein n=2 Tax=Candidatus Wildermuthiibacteriota TaxID=1817923 RepID=A0A1G2RFI3_9BACT|nr:MAG: hypothetical protein A3J68_01340 [Candidatus Wildermuthbacteria bacterium RIFCSPHIGHO2_02_FULL_48_16]OHA71614.1 MAG: hypothetical protein A3A27_02045 [Candidatus Wildermuthbacteria bacterium RIFCSPLOWO2_01_FULL_47_18]